MQSLTKHIGRIFQPLLDAFGGILAFFYSIIPNYPIDVALLTIVHHGPAHPADGEEHQEHGRRCRHWLPR